VLFFQYTRLRQGFVSKKKNVYATHAAGLFGQIIKNNNIYFVEKILINTFRKNIRWQQNIMKAIF
jgi:hypothetical protein